MPKKSKKSARRGPESQKRKTSKEPDLKKLKEHLWVQLKGVKGLNGVGIGDKCLAVRVVDTAAKDRVFKKLGGPSFRGADVDVQVTGVIRALAVAAA